MHRIPTRAVPTSAVPSTLAAAALLTLSACSLPSAEEASSSAVGGSTASAQPTTTESAAAPGADDTPITIAIGDTTISATLNDSAAAQDFADTLPQTVPSIRNRDIEYFGTVAEPLTETGPFFNDVEPGHVVYYAPKDEVALIFEPTSSPGQLTHIGDITSDLSVFDGLPVDADIVYALASS